MDIFKLAIPALCLAWGVIGGVIVWRVWEWLCEYTDWIDNDRGLK